MMGALLLAQSTDTATSAAVGTAAAGFAVFWIIFIIIASIVGLIFLIWWIILLIDLSKRDFPEKTTWLIIMIVGFVVGLLWLSDLLYYFMVVKKQGKAGGSAPSAPAAS
jgi:hypothetical protein